MGTPVNLVAVILELVLQLFAFTGQFSDLQRIGLLLWQGFGEHLVDLAEGFFKFMNPVAMILGDLL